MNLERKICCIGIALLLILLAIGFCTHKEKQELLQPKEDSMGIIIPVGLTGSFDESFRVSENVFKARSDVQEAFANNQVSEEQYQGFMKSYVTLINSSIETEGLEASIRSFNFVTKEILGQNYYCLERIEDQSGFSYGIRYHMIDDRIIKDWNVGKISNEKYWQYVQTVDAKLQDEITYEKANQLIQYVTKVWMESDTILT